MIFLFGATVTFHVPVFEFFLQTFSADSEPKNEAADFEVVKEQFLKKVDKSRGPQEVITHVISANPDTGDFANCMEQVDASHCKEAFYSEEIFGLVRNSTMDFQDMESLSIY